MDRDRLIESIINNEGFRVRPYLDSLGVETVGIGFNVKYLNFERYGLNKDNLYIPYKKALEILHDKIDDLIVTYENLPWFIELPGEIKEVLIEVAYNIGIIKLYGFKKMMKYIKKGDWNKAADEMLDSKWAKQVGKRAVKLSEIVRNCKE